MRYVLSFSRGYVLEVSDIDINGDFIRPTEVRQDKKIKHRARKIHFKNDNAFFIWYGQRYYLMDFCRVE